MTQMNFDFSTKKGRLNAAKKFANEFKQHITEEEAINVSYSDDKNILTNGAASPRELRGFIMGMIHNMPVSLALILLKSVEHNLMEEGL